MSTKYQTDVIIIGAGPVGLFAVFQCGMLGLKTHVVDALPEIGGQCTALYPEKPIYDIPAWPQITGGDLIVQLEKQAEPFDPVYHLNQQATGLKKDADGKWVVTTSNGTEITAPAIMIAAGAGAFGPKRPPLEGLESFENKSVFYMVREREAFRGKRIVIAGGGDSAVDWALSLSELAEHVMVVHRRPKFRAAPDSVEKMKALEAEGKIEMVIPYQLAGLEGSDGQLSSVIVKTLDGETRALEADILLPFFGLATDLGPISDWGLNIVRNTIDIHQSTSATSEPGIYAVGDVANYDKKVKLILCGFSEVALAAHDIYHYIHPDVALHFEYSTSKGTPGAK